MTHRARLARCKRLLAHVAAICLMILMLGLAACSEALRAILGY